MRERTQLTAVQFGDKNHGWIGGQGGVLYSTADGGRTWRTSQLDSGSRSYVSSMSFLRGAVGWVVVRRDPTEPMNRAGYESMVLKTNNAGQSWDEQRTWRATQIYRVRFVNNEEGWLVGRNLENDGLFLSHTTDGGANWTELSSTSLTISGNDFGTDVYAVEPSKATLLTAAGRIYATLDSGRNWQQYFVIQDEPEQTFMARVRMLQNKNLWVLGSTDSREGMWTTIIKQQDRHSTRFRVDGVRIRDLVFVSENEIIACGSMPTSDSALFGSRTGVVLYCPDEGQSWVKMYSDAEGRTLNAIAIDGDIVWIVGDDGLLLQVTPR